MKDMMKGGKVVSTSTFKAMGNQNPETAAFT